MVKLRSPPKIKLGAERRPPPKNNIPKKFPIPVGDIAVDDREHIIDALEPCFDQDTCKGKKGFVMDSKRVPTSKEAPRES